MTETKCGFVSIISLPNAGKSTLINKLVKNHISIVTHKAQTTRSLIRGISTSGNSQVIFVDTPGIGGDGHSLYKVMTKTVRLSASDSDLVTLLVDARQGLNTKLTNLIRTIKNWNKALVLVLNKIDIVRRDSLLKLTADIHGHAEFLNTFMISALKGDGTEDLLRWLHDKVPQGEWLYPEDQVRDIPLHNLAAEITRKHILLSVHDELPYNLEVETSQWTPLRDKSVSIHQTIHVGHLGHKKILLGKHGRSIKHIAMAARSEIIETLGQPVHLFLFVKVHPKQSRKIGTQIQE